MKEKIIAILIMINLMLVGGIYNLINKVNVNNQKQIIKEMTETEYEDNIKSLNVSHEEYANYIEESKKKIASAITDMGVTTSNEETLENMANNIKSIGREASSITYNNTNSGLKSTNVQEAVDELDGEIDNLNQLTFNDSEKIAYKPIGAGARSLRIVIPFFKDTATINVSAKYYHPSMGWCDLTYSDYQISGNLLTMLYTTTTETELTSNSTYLVKLTGTIS